ncbi:Alpha/Beta hydrolase protein [Fimicolochytrium jonesii]|uniref:Alpha/Beta hydrolase protein n=1 Tax=Fimicolochytrium jonesii TaxID=1396493 RepID=UPI0022FF0B00|nr:Alpha/Beta hydrolase protein [Fimicolochytrium jonesii]KAI8821863.1 Alpha/Beta hydrolase protein [Fimicolochytrium jonesii]
MNNMHVETYAPTTATAPPRSTLILIHGGALSHRMYRTTTPFLTSLGYPISAPDLPGHGASASLRPFSFASSTAHIHEYIQSLRAATPGGKIVLVGISLGGQAVLDLIAHHPDAVDAAVVCSASIHPPSDPSHPTAMPKMPSDQVPSLFSELKTSGTALTQLRSSGIAPPFIWWEKHHRYNRGRILATRFPVKRCFAAH